MTNDTNPAPAPRMRLWLRILLGVSLALNLLVLGLAVGAAIRFGPEQHRPPPRTIGALLYHELPREARQALRAEMNLTPETRRLRREDEAHRLGEALRAVPFDAAAVNRLLQERVEAQADWQAAVQRAWLDRVAAMDDAARAAYADRVERALTRTGHGDRDGDRPGARDRD